MSVDGDSVVHRKDVETGVRNAGRVQILKGVSPGEQVVIVGGMGLEDGAKVQIRNSGGKPEQK
jgi:multidrug efflux pump subunit AcrA (membrane-fusion protein)